MPYTAIGFSVVIKDVSVVRAAAAKPLTSLQLAAANLRWISWTWICGNAWGTQQKLLEAY